jgi:hypothetical protein
MAATTVRDIITRAMRALNLIGADEDPDAGEASKHLATLNAMALGWDADKVHAGWQTVEISDDFPLEAKHEEGVTYLLAKRIAADSGITLSPDQRALADKGWARLCADYKARDTLRMDDGLRMPSERNFARLPPVGWW